MTTTIHLNDNTIKVGDLNFDKSQFDIPKKVIILNSRISYQYVEVNGEQTRTNNIAKIVCSVQDADKAKVLQEMGIDLTELKPFTLEILDNLDKVSRLMETDGLLEQTVEPVNLQVRLMWSAARSNWSGVKLVASDIKVIA